MKTSKLNVLFGEQLANERVAEHGDLAGTLAMVARLDRISVTGMATQFRGSRLQMAKQVEEGIDGEQIGGRLAFGRLAIEFPTVSNRRRKMPQWKV